MTAVGISVICERFRSQVSLELDDELSQLERRMLVAHLERCSHCRAYSADVTAFTQELRAAPLEPLENPIAVPRRRRLVTARLQVGAAAAVAIAALGVANQFAASDSRGLLSGPGTLTRYPTQSQLERELAILDSLAEPSRISAADIVL